MCSANFLLELPRIRRETRDRTPVECLTRIKFKKQGDSRPREISTPRSSSGES
ncbi:hypothetical protein WN51_12254 [Melipona quadrifasciata]|uniref:Uncharacterized protein n=1 Tax=Melipona quadrifasciata TaxID=166423 RepID=A0A0M9A1N9_9HYME|nr:hypothetical protein WN51_12254 [Melipona quadrifasciata]